MECDVIMVDHGYVTNTAENQYSAIVLQIFQILMFF